MRTYLNAVSTNRNVFGFGQDRVVTSLNATCAHAAQHLSDRHASKRSRKSDGGLKRRVVDLAALASPAPWAKQMCLAITGSQGPARRTSPAIVKA